MSLPSLEFYRDRKKQHRWRVRAGNGRVLADSGESYTRPGKARQGFVAAFQAMCSCRHEMVAEAVRNDPVAAIRSLARSKATSVAETVRKVRK